jgi:hypothetical protein
MRLYKKILNQDDETYSYVPTLITTNNGELWLKDTLTVGELAPVSWIDENGQS